MKSPLRSLRGWFSGVSRRRDRKNRAPRRRLRLESLETRRLLTADLAAIAGTVFVDLTDDGMTADDTRLEGITVNLYRDGGDQQFEGDTTLWESVMTDSNGNYRFDNLEAGLYFVEQEAIDGLLQRPEETVRPVEITDDDAKGIRQSIDSFDVTPQSLELSSVDPVSDSNGVAAPEALGGHRHMYLELQQGPGDVRMRVMHLGQPAVSYTSDFGVIGRGVITWDGGGAGDQLDPAGLGGVDLSYADTAWGITLEYVADHEGAEINLHVYTDGANYSTFSDAIPKSSTADTNEVSSRRIRFDDFEVDGGDGADFTNVGAIQLGFQGVSAMQAVFHRLATFGPTVITQDFANLNPLSLGDTVWFDANNNGFLDSGESGIPGVELTLYEHTDGSGTFNPDVDLPLANLTTDAAGRYLFTDLFPGDYIVQVDPANFQPGGALHEMVSSTAFATPPDPNNNVDGDDNGYPLAGHGVVSLAINLSAGGEPAPDPNTNLTLDFGFTRLADLQVVKTGVPNPVSAGEQLTYTVVVTNEGPSPAANVVLTDTLPDGVTFDAAASDDRLVVNGNLLTADLGTISVGESMDVIIVVTVGSDFAGNELLNTAAVASGTPDPNLDDNTDDETTGVVRTVNLAIEKDADLAQAIAGSELVYTLQVTNQGPSDATGVTVGDTLPADVTFVSATNEHGAVTEAGGVVTADLGNLPAGDTKEFEITVLVSPSAGGTILANVADVTATEAPIAVQAAINTPVIAQADLGITKTGAPDPVVAGTQLVYTLEVTNYGPSDATNVTVTDNLPAGVNFVATDHPDFNIVGNTLNVNIGNLAENAIERFTVTVDVAPDTRGNLVNQAAVTGAEDDPNTANNADTVQTPVLAEIDLVINKTGAPNPVDAGDTLTYTLVVTNNGPSQATGVTVTDPLPGGLTYVAGSGTVAGDATQGVVGVTGGTMTAVLGEMAPGATATITFQTTVAPNLQGPIINTSSVAGVEPETNPDDNAATFTIDVTPPVDADVAITKQVTPHPVVAGADLTYTLTVTNNGPSPAEGVKVVDQLPTELDFDAANSTPGLVFDAAENTVTANVGNLAPGASQIITIGATVNPGARGNLVNTATVQALTPDSVPGNNQDNAVTTIIAQADLEITKTGSDPNPVPGGELIYTLVVTNHGPSAATGVTIQDILPAGVDYVAADNDANFTHNNGIVGINVGSLGVGENRQFQINTRVQDGFEGRLLNSAQVWGIEFDPVPGNNRDDDTSNVATQASSLAGFVYVDTNRDGTMQADEPRLEGVAIQLTGTARDGTTINRNTNTDAAGQFQFQDLPAGVYNLRQVPPPGYLRGVNVPDPGVFVAGIDGDEFLGINLDPGVAASNFLFGHQNPAFSKRLFLSSTNGLV